MGILFDLDGTLLDSMTVHAECMYKALKAKPYGGKIKYAFVLKHIRSPYVMFCAELEKTYRIKLDKKARESLLRSKDEVFKANKAKGIRLFPHSAEIVEFLVKRGIKTCIVSSINDSELNVVRKKARIDDLNIKIINSKTKKQEKPNPYTLNLAIKEFRMDKSKTVYVGDSIYDSIASRRAGIGFIGVHNTELKRLGRFFHDLPALERYIKKHYAEYKD